MEENPNKTVKNVFVDVTINAHLVEEKFRKQKQRKGHMAIEIAAEFRVWM
jgi:hypothetical protein